MKRDSVLPRASPGLVLGLLACAPAACSAASEVPFLTGRFAFQRATKGQQDAQVWLCEPSASRLGSLTGRYPLTDAINPHFSPDKSTIIFGAVSASDERDIFSLRLGADGAPNRLANLSANNGLRDEDAKFSSDAGSSIVFKQSLQIALMDPDGTNVRSLPLGSVAIERSGPCFTQDNASIVFWEGVDRPERDTDSDLYSYSLATGQKMALAATPNVAEYYPMAWTHSRILFTRATRTVRGVADPDQLWSLNLRTLAAERLKGSINLPGADSSDAFPINSRLILFSSTRQGGLGGYDLYVGDATTGEVWPMSQVAPGLAINTAREELGAAYAPGPLAITAAAPGAPPGARPVAWAEDGGAVVLAPGLRINDDSELLGSARVTLPPQASLKAALSASTLGTPITAGYDALTRTLSLSGSATPAQYKSVLRTVAFNDASQNPTPGVLTVRFEVRSGAQSAAATVGLQVLAG